MNPLKERIPVRIAAQGVLTRSVRDTALFLALTDPARPDAGLPPIGHVTSPSTQRLRIGMCVTTLRGARGPDRRDGPIEGEDEQAGGALVEPMYRMHVLADLVAQDLYGKAGRAWLRAVTLPEITRVQVDLLLELVDAVDARVKRLDQRIRKTVAQDAAAERLQTVPGIGPFGALLLLITVPVLGLFVVLATGGLLPPICTIGGATGLAGPRRIAGA